MPLMTSLLLILGLARALGRIAKRLGHPPIVGEMLAGVVLGPAALKWVQASSALSGVSDLAVFLVVLSAGLEMELRNVLVTLRGRGFWTAPLSFAVPFVMGVGLGYWFDLSGASAVVLGLCISVTALPVTVRLLESFGLLNTHLGRYAVALAIWTDLIALFLLGALFHSGGGVVESATKLLGFVAFIFLCNRVLEWAEAQGGVLYRHTERIASLLGSEALLGTVVLVVLGFASISELLGFPFVLGAFFGALLLSKALFRAHRYQEMKVTLGSVTDGLFAPIFFAQIGLGFSFASFPSIGFVVGMLLISVGSKVGVGWLGGRIAGMSSREALRLGVILNGRGAMELVFASVALQLGVIDQGVYSALVLMGVFTTVVTPVWFKRLVPR